MFPKVAMFLSELDTDKTKSISHVGQCIECWVCRQRTSCSGSDLIEATKNIGWQAVVDFQRKRVLVFCSDECKEMAKSKRTGMFRWKRP